MTSRELPCDHCRRVQDCRWLPDPFIAEVYPEDDNPPSWWCDDCYADRYDDV